MKRLVLICLLPVAAFLFVAGCSSKPKKSPLVATEVESNFRERWIAKRASDLVATKQVADAAEAQRIATGEFKQRFASTSVIQREKDAEAGATSAK